MSAQQIPSDLQIYFDRYVWPRKIGCSPRTKNLYDISIRHFSRFLERPATLDDLNDETVCAFVSYRTTVVNGHTAAKERTNLLVIAEYAAKKRHIPEFLDIPRVPVVWPTPTALRIEQFNRLLDACQRMRGTIKGAPARIWWRAYLLLSVVTGERTEAMLSLRWEWLGSDGWLRVPADARKGRKKAMQYRLPSKVVEEIEALRQSGNPLIFDRAFCKGTFYLHYDKLLHWADLPTGRRMKSQALRRTFASYVKMLGGDSTAALDHESAATTKRHYNDPTLCVAEKAPGDLVAHAFGLL